MKYKNTYIANGSGYFAKFGVIVTPGMGLRFGAAIQTPTVNVIEETWFEEGNTAFSDSRYNASAYSPTAS